MIYFPGKVEAEGSVFDHGELRAGAAIMLSQLQRIATVQTAPPVSPNILLDSYCPEPSHFLLSV